MKKRKEIKMAEKENQQEQILSQTKSLYDKVAGNSELTKGVEQALTGAGNVAIDATKGVAKTANDVTKIVGTGMTIPGVAVEKAGDFVGGVAKAPGEGVQKVTKLVGDATQAPGALVQGTGDLVGKGFSAAGQAIGSGTEALLGKTAGDLVKGSWELTGGIVKGATGIVGGVLKVPGELIKGVGNFTGEVLKLPGNLFQGATKVLGGVLKAPGQILQGIANGTENLLFKTKDGAPTLNGETLTGPKMSSKEVINALEKGEIHNAKELGLKGLGGASSVFIYGNELNKMDSFAKNMSTLANGKEGADKPFSSILTKPKSERAAAVKEATVQLRSDLHKIKDRLENNPGSFTPQQETELKLVMKGIEQQGGIDKYMAKNFDLPENYQNKEKVNDMVKDAQTHSDKGRESMKKQTESVEKDASEQGKENKEKSRGDSKESKPLTPQEKLEDMKKSAQESTDKAKSGMKKQIESIQKDTKDKTNAFKDKQAPSLGDKDVKPVISGNAPTMQAPTKSINGIGR